MPRNTNSVESSILKVTLSWQSLNHLEALAKLGIYGRNAAEVASRFVDERLRDFTEKPVLSIGTRKKK
jgi:hypothetical protein